MKTRLGFVIFTLIMASCMARYSCPTYDSAKGRSSSMASGKKLKASKIPMPYYKTTKQAEKD